MFQCGIPDPDYAILGDQGVILLSFSRVLSVVLCISFSIAVPANAWEWSQTGWSEEDFDWTESIEIAEDSAALVLANDPDHLILAFDASDSYAGVWSILNHHDRLHMAVCTSPMGDIGGDILAYDPATNSVSLEYQVHEEGNLVLCVLDEMLFCPGLDNLDGWEWGNIYLDDGTGWQRKETLPEAIHVHDLVMHEGRLFASTGIGPPGYEGVLYASDDLGDSWEEILRVDSHPPESYFRRLYGLASWEGSLFVQSDFWYPEGDVIFEMTATDTTAHTVPGGEYCFAGFLPYQDKLLYLTRLFLGSYDGEEWVGLPRRFPSYNFAARSLTLYRDRIYVGGFQGLAWTDDLATWNEVPCANLTGKETECFAVLDGRLYMGSSGDAEVFVTPAVSAGELISLAHEFPDEICAGDLDWEAMTPPGTSVAFQLRSADSEADLAERTFRGPDGREDSWYTIGGTELADMHCGDRWFQWKLRMNTPDPALAPVLRSVTLRVEVGDPSAADPIPGTAALRAWPNPFSGDLNIAVGSGGSAVRIYHPSGRLLRRLELAPGGGMIWDGRDAEGRELPAGVYLLRRNMSEGQEHVRRVVRLR